MNKFKVGDRVATRFESSGGIKHGRGATGTVIYAGISGIMVWWDWSTLGVNDDTQFGREWWSEPADLRLLDEMDIMVRAWAKP